MHRKGASEILVLELQIVLGAIRRNGIRKEYVQELKENLGKERKHQPIKAYANVIQRGVQIAS